MKRVPELQINVRLPAPLVNEVDAFCDARGVKKKEVVELALRRLLVAEKEKPL